MVRLHYIIAPGLQLLVAASESERVQGILSGGCSIVGSACENATVQRVVRAASGVPSGLMRMPERTALCLEPLEDWGRRHLSVCTRRSTTNTKHGVEIP